jgi:hypothetical protein
MDWLLSLLLDLVLCVLCAGLFHAGVSCLLIPLSLSLSLLFFFTLSLLPFLGAWVIVAVFGDEWWLSSF